MQIIPDRINNAFPTMGKQFSVMCVTITIRYTLAPANMNIYGI